MNLMDGRRGLSWIAARFSHHHDLRASGFRVFDDPLHLSRSHQTSFVNDEHIVG